MNADGKSYETDIKKFGFVLNYEKWLNKFSWEKHWILKDL